MERAKYEQEVLREMRGLLLGPNGQPKKFEATGPGDTIQIEDVRLDTSEPEHRIIVTLRDLDRAECLFGFEMEAIEWRQPGYEPYFLGPEIWTTIVWANLQERIVGKPLPADCSPGEITWV